MNQNTSSANDLLLDNHFACVTGNCLHSWWSGDFQGLDFLKLILGFFCLLVYEGGL